MSKPNLLIFASGSRDGGGSGFQNLVEHARKGVLRANIVGVISNHPDGGVQKRAKSLGVPFLHFRAPYLSERYQGLTTAYRADFVALSGWLKIVRGLSPRRTFNIHPGPLPRFGGAGMYGHHVHEAVLNAYHKGEISYSAVTMHFVTEQYDEGPVFFRQSVPIESNDTVETLGKRVNETELAWQPILTDRVISGEIRWDGVNPASLTGHTAYVHGDPSY